MQRHSHAGDLDPLGTVLTGRTVPIDVDTKALQSAAVNIEGYQALSNRLVNVKWVYFIWVCEVLW